MESQNKVKKSRDVGFDNVKDPNVKLEIMKLVRSPADATNFIFWYSKINPEEWGLTLKSIPSRLEKDGFPSQHTWKITWVFRSDASGDRLAVANHCKSLAGDVTGPEFERVSELYRRYRNKI